MVGAWLRGGGLAVWWGPGCWKTAAEAGGPEEPQGGAHTSWAFELLLCDSDPAEVLSELFPPLKN